MRRVATTETRSRGVLRGCGAPMAGRPSRPLGASRGDRRNDPCGERVGASAVVHTRSGPGLVLTVADGVIEGGVTDHEPRLPRTTDPQAPTGDEEINERLMD